MSRRHDRAQKYFAQPEVQKSFSERNAKKKLQREIERFSISEDEVKRICSSKVRSDSLYLLMVDLYLSKLLEYPLNCTGDCCAGDEIVFVERLFTGVYPNAKFAGFALREGKIIKEWYRSDFQHNFYIELCDGTRIQRRGRNVYRFLTLRKLRPVKARNVALHEKHQRGAKSREAKREYYAKHWREYR